MASGKEDSAFIALLLIILVVVPVYAYAYRSTRPGSQQDYAIGDFRIVSTSVDATGLNRNGLTLNIIAVVYNSNVFGATLEAANYSIYANGHYLGTGKTTHEYDVASQSSQVLAFPISVSWKSALHSLWSYTVAWGNVSWKVNGTAIIEVGGLPLISPFELAAG